MTDLISREAAIAWHIDRRDEAKANAGRCRSTDEEAACRYLEEAILHGDAINAFRALPAQAHVVKVKPLEWRRNEKSHLDCTYVDNFGLFQIADDENVTLLWAGQDTTCAPYASLEDAKAAAQADYEARILAAIEPVTAQPLDKPAQS